MGILNKLGGQLWLQSGSGAGVATLTGNRTLTGDSAHLQVLNPSGANRDVILPNIGTTARGVGQWFELRNSGTTYNLVVKDSAGSTVATVTPGNYVKVVAARVGGTNGWYIAHSLLSLASLALSGTLTATGGLLANTVGEITPAAGVTVDGCLIKDGRAALLATAGLFASAEQTGTGSSQNIAHGFGAAPSQVWWAVSDSGATGIYTAVPGTHDGTNIKMTVTSGVKYYVFALK
jgi:hypothetical protein